MKQINVVFNEKENRYITIYRTIKDMIVSGTLNSGDSLPSRRGMAAYLSVSPNTVLNAYSLLLQEGYIESKDKSGYYVASGRNYRKESSLKSENNVAEQEVLYDFTSRNVDKDSFPYYTFKKVADAIIADHPEIWLLRSPYQGSLSLRKTIASYLYENKGMNVSEENIVIVSGLEESMEIVTTITSVKKIGMENPSYRKIHSFFKERNKEIVLFPVDEKGIILDKKEQLDLMYVTPYNQFPLGIRMSNERRRQLLDYPVRYIFEDDFDCDLINQNKIMSTLYSMNNANVIYHGSFSHTLCGGLRLSYLVLPSSLVPSYHKMYEGASSRISSLDQELLAKFLSEGHYYRHLTKVKKELAQKKEIIKKALKSVKNITFKETELSFVITLSGDIKEIRDRLPKKKIAVSFIEDYLYEGSSPDMILSYIGISERDLEKGLQELFSVIA